VVSVSDDLAAVTVAQCKSKTRDRVFCFCDAKSATGARDANRWPEPFFLFIDDGDHAELGLAIAYNQVRPATIEPAAFLPSGAIPSPPRFPNASLPILDRRNALVRGLPTPIVGRPLNARAGTS